MSESTDNLARELERMASQDSIDTGPALRQLLTAVAQLMREVSRSNELQQTHNHDDRYILKADYDKLEVRVKTQEDETSKWKNVAKGIAIGGTILGTGLGVSITKILAMLFGTP